MVRKALPMHGALVNFRLYYKNRTLRRPAILPDDLQYAAETGDDSGLRRLDRTGGSIRLEYKVSRGVGKITGILILLEEKEEKKERERD
ncbi:MAG: hypothetical protein SVV80_01920 [Planctomycetota bacterium]|nr:hypothetical protein [Planctomycetota bacterium]